MDFKLNLQRFAEGEGGEAAPAAGAETATAAETSAAPAVNVGTQLPNGQTVQSPQVAAAMNRQMKKHPELRQVYGQNQGAGQPGANQPAGPTIEQRWEEAKKGEFAEMYGRDVQRAIQDRFKNQSDVNDQLNRLEPMLKVLRDRAGVSSNDELIKEVMDDDSLYEEDAQDMGMSVDAYRKFKEMEAERDQMLKQQAEERETAELKNHFQKLSQQAEAFKQTFPQFDLQKELQNRKFFQLTSKEIGMSVEDAYYAIHHRELTPQMLSYGMQRAKQQMGNTIQAQQKRPAENAMKGQSKPAAEVRIDPRSLSRREREEIRRQIHAGKKVSFD